MHYCPECGYLNRKELGKTPDDCPECRAPMHNANEKAVQKKGKKKKPECLCALPEIQQQKCTACGICIELCSFGAIRQDDGVFYILPSLCVQCGICVHKCPVGAIT